MEATFGRRLCRLRAAGGGILQSKRRGGDLMTTGCQQSMSGLKRAIGILILVFLIFPVAGPKSACAAQATTDVLNWTWSYHPLVWTSSHLRLGKCRRRRLCCRRGRRRFAL